MKNAGRISFVIGMILVLAGIAVCVLVLAVGGWDFQSLSTKRCVTNTYDITEEFQNIRLDTATADVRLVPSADGVCRVVCFEYDTMPHTVLAEGGVLSVTVRDERRLVDHISLITVKSPVITVHLPQKEYEALSVSVSTGDVEIAREFTFGSIAVATTTGDVNCRASASGELSIAVSTGDIALEHVSADAISLATTTGDMLLRDITCAGDARLSVTSGDTSVTNLTCADFISKGNTGDLILENALAGVSFSVTRTTGDIKLESCDAAEMTLKTGTGDITGTLLSEKIFAAKTNTGRLQVPQTSTGGVCSLTTTTGDIRISLK